MHEFASKEEYDNFLRSEKNKDKLIVIDFYADWCGPCRKMKPYFKKCEGKYPDVVFAKVDVDDAEAIAEEEEVEVMPTFIFFKNGERLHKFCGSDEKELEEKIKELK
ncbi:thioredoxin-like isoform X2 [Porites lutea]|uniref:thioredoxin-like isoform X2 n=1 Tax=Porites lutea TaxID=51062 RepID=UPI003CC5FCCA